ncbi:uncharacterized protein LOC144144881 [Haemaphysalis longicornis]
MPPRGDNHQPQTAPMASWHPQREPRGFWGKEEEDVEEWLTHFKRVSRYNRWDASAQLSNVVFSSNGTALTWFENQEEKLTTSDRFVEEILARFGDSAAKKKKAEQTLLQRAQVPGETCSTYIEEVLKLCRIINPQMSEEDKVGHLLKGIAEDVYHFLISREKLESAADVIQQCRTFEALKTRRITPKFGRLTNVTTVASVDDNPPPDLADTIRRIVREELARHQAYQDNIDRGHTREDYFIQELQANTLQPSNAGFNDRNFVTGRESSRRVLDHESARYGPENFRRRPQRPYYPPRFHDAYDEYTTGREREPPVCYKCGVAGHISRYCRRRRQGTRYEPPRVFYRSEAGDSRYDDHWPTSSFSGGQPPTRHNSPARHDSPASDRSVTPPILRRRRSPSPRRRSPPPGN